MSAPQYFLEVASGEDILLEVTLSSATFTLTAADIVDVVFKMWADLGASPVVTKNISSGISILGADSAGVDCLVVIPSAEVAALNAGRAYSFTLTASTSSQKSLSAQGSITLSKPNIA